jgi:hypothetical protein
MQRHALDVLFQNVLYVILAIELRFCDNYLGVEAYNTGTLTLSNLLF